MLATDNVSLVLPCWELRESYIECLRDFQSEDPSRPIKWEWMENFELYLKWFRDQQLPEGEAPQTTYWIVWNGNQAVGKLTLRHKLTPKLEELGGHFGYEVRPAFRRRGIATQALKLGLEKARDEGLTKIIITCDDDNTGSIRTLENNGGQLINTYHLDYWPKSVRKYRFNEAITAQ